MLLFPFILYWKENYFHIGNAERSEVPATSIYFASSLLLMSKFVAAAAARTTYFFGAFRNSHRLPIIKFTGPI